MKVRMAWVTGVALVGSFWFLMHMMDAVPRDIMQTLPPGAKMGVITADAGAAMVLVLTSVVSILIVIFGGDD